MAISIIRELAKLGLTKLESEEKRGSTRWWFRWPEKDVGPAVIKMLADNGIVKHVYNYRSADYNVTLDNGDGFLCIAKFKKTKFGAISRARRDEGLDF